MRTYREGRHIYTYTLAPKSRTLTVVVHAVCSTPPKEGLNEANGGRKPRGERKGGLGVQVQDDTANRAAAARSALPANTASPPPATAGKHLPAPS